MTALADLVCAISDLDAHARRLVASAASAGDFDDVAQLMPIAKEISQLAARWSSSTQATNVEDAVTDDQAIIARPVSNRSARPARSKKDQYPQFVRERDDLVKLGWSVLEKKPYEHRLPKSALDLITRTVAVKGKTGQRFSMDELLKAIEARNGEGFPSYQAYAAVSWLKQNGMLVQHGRQGYTVVRPQTFNDSVQTAWQALKRR